MKGPLRVVWVLAIPSLLLGGLEISGGGLATPAEMYLREGRNYADVMTGLYPRRDGYRFLKAQQLGLCRQQPGQDRRRHGACRDLGDVTLSEIRAELERAIETGVTSNEDLLRIYAEVLVEDRAAPTDIDRARARLFRHHPHP
tara:strand:+ start:244 stop:672 length:429 start_codon:yes stop_codon:yes gene_type:complete